jgi:sugar O-acyltransferase (sialic acid O-acetyltransferase NeuD family)
MPGSTLILIGGGGHALVVAEAAALAGLALAGFLDDDDAAPLARGAPSCPHLDPLSELQGYAERGCILAVGDLVLRRGLIGRLSAAVLVSVIHPRAVVSPSATIGSGVYVGPGAVVHTRAQVGDHAIINSGAVVEHECRIGENSHIAPGTAIGGRVSIGADTLIGLGARVLPNVTIGDGCVIAAGATVTRNVRDRARVVGTPAAPM